MKCVKFIFFSMMLMTVTIFGQTGFGQQENSRPGDSASVTETDVPSAQADGTAKDAEIKNIPISAKPENADKAEALSAGKSETPESEEEKETAVSKPDAPEMGETKETELSPEKSETPESKNARNSQSAHKTLSVQVNKANVRNEASLGAKVNAQLKKGQAVTLIEVKDEWYHIQLEDGEHGWVHRSTLGEKTVRGKDRNPGDSIALTVNGNIRKSPDLRSEVLTVVKKGTAVALKESGEEWYQVQLADGREGWAHKKIFAKRAPARLQKMEGIRIEKGGKNEEKVYFLYKGPKPPNIFFTKSGSPRIVCDFSNTRPGKGIGQKIEVRGNLIQAVRTGLHGENQSNLRIVFDVVPGSDYELEHSFAEKETYLLIVRKH